MVFRNNDVFRFKSFPLIYGSQRPNFIYYKIPNSKSLVYFSSTNELAYLILGNVHGIGGMNSKVIRLVSDFSFGVLFKFGKALALQVSLIAVMDFWI